MLKVKNSKKVKLATLVLCAIALTGCKNTVIEKENSLIPTSISEIANSENEIVNKIKYTISDGYISIKYDKYSDDEEVDEEMYTSISNSLKDERLDTLFVDDINNQVDFNRFDLSNIKMVWINRPGENFDYKPFLSPTYTNVSIEVGENTNTENIIAFLKNLKLNHGLVTINFKDNFNVDMQNEYLRALSNVSQLDKLHITSNIIDKLDLTIAKPNELVVYVDTNDPHINYELNINSEVQYFTLVPSYPEEYEDIATLDNITINSDNEELIIYTFIFKYWDEEFKAKITENTKINVPIKSFLCLNGINLEELTDKEFEVFRNLPYVYITNPDDFKKYFEYNSNTMTLEEAIQNYHASLVEKSLKNTNSISC